MADRPDFPKWQHPVRDPLNKLGKNLFSYAFKYAGASNNAERTFQSLGYQKGFLDAPEVMPGGSCFSMDIGHENECDPHSAHEYAFWQSGTHRDLCY